MGAVETSAAISRSRDGGDTRTVLLALSGPAPAVLTETVWALAHERPPVLPDEVVVLTTSVGREALLEHLFRRGGWNRLLAALVAEGLDVANRLRFGPAAACLRMFPSADGSRNLADLTTAADHHAAADFILESLRTFTEDPETRVVASLAGGRRTTSALLLSCMSLLARRDDRLCHVLVPPPYDQPGLTPLFLFPEAGVVHRLPGRLDEYPSEEARVELVEVPFVRLRSLYQQRFRRLPPSYSALVRKVERWSTGANLPELEIDPREGRVRVGGRRLVLSSFEFGFLLVVARRLARGESWRSWAEIGEDMERLQEHCSRSDPEWLHEFRARKLDVLEDPRKLASTLRRKLEELTGDPAVGRRLLPDLKRREPPSFPAERIRFLTSSDVAGPPQSESGG